MQKFSSGSVVLKPQNGHLFCRGGALCEKMSFEAGADSNLVPQLLQNTASLSVTSKPQALHTRPAGLSS